MQMLDSRSDNQGGQSSAPSQEPEPQVQKVDNSFDNFDDDIPF
jgi:hypothetical protein